MKPLPSQIELTNLLSYDPLTGSLTWRSRPELNHRIAIWNARFSGTPALNNKTVYGYLRGAIDNNSFLSHRVIWKMVYGTEPRFIDHEDGDRSNNKLRNLRDVTKLVNSKNKRTPSNNTTGVMGVYPKKDKWRASIKVNRRQHHIGTFSTFDEAVAARKQAEKDLGFHANHGNKKQ